jgi:hypothetical protein
MGVQRDSGRDALEQYFLASAIAIVLGSLLFAALAIAVLLDWLEAGATTAVLGFLSAVFGLYFGYRLFGLYGTAIGLRAGPTVDHDHPVEESAEIVPFPAIDLSVSRSARRLIARAGGRAYVWLSAVGDDYGWLNASTRDPGHTLFIRFGFDGGDVFVARDVRVPRLKLRRSRLFPWRLVAEWPGSASGGSTIL